MFGPKYDPTKLKVIARGAHTSQHPPPCPNFAEAGGGGELLRLRLNAGEVTHRDGRR